MSNIVTVTSLTSNSSCEYRLKKVAKEKKPNFTMIGNGTMSRHNIQSICMINVTANATAAGRFVIRTFVNTIDYSCEDGVVKVPMSELTASEKVTWQKGFKELEALGYILRTKRSHYALNPNMLIPREYTKGVDIWNSKCREEFRIQPIT